MSDRYDTPRWDDDPPELDEAPGERERHEEPSSEDDARPSGEAVPAADVLGDPWERAARETRAAEPDPQREPEPEDVDRSSENVLAAWPASQVSEGSSEPASSFTAPEDRPSVTEGWAPSPPPASEGPAVDASRVVGGDDVHEPGEQEPGEGQAPVEVAAPPELGSTTAEHAPGDLVVPPGIPLLEGVPRGERRAVGIVVSRFNGDVTTKLLDGALAELLDRGVASESITVMPVPGAFELPLAAMALAKTRRFSCVIALGCVIRGGTPHFDYVASEAASGVQLAALETGVPVAFGVLTLDHADQAEARLGKGAEAVRTALEMADLFANLRAAAAR